MADPAPVAAIPLSTTPPLRELWRYARGHRPRVAFAATFSLLNKACDVAPELLIGAAVDVVAKGSDSFVGGLFGVEDKFTQLTILTVITVLVWFAESATEYIAVVTWRNLAQTIEHEARIDTYRHVQDLEMAYFEDRTSGGLMTVLNEDVNQLERFLDLGPHKLLITAANVVFVGIVFFVVSPLLAALAFLPIPVIVVGSLWYQTRLEPRYARVREAGGEIGNTLTNSLGGMATIKAFSGEEREAERVAADSRAYREANRDAIRFSTAFNPLIRMAVLAGFTMTLIVGGRAALRGELALGVFSMLVYMTQRLLWPLVQLGETLDLYQRAMASCRRIFGLLAVEPTIVPGTHDLELPVRGAVRFDDVRFAYGTGSPTSSSSRGTAEGSCPPARNASPSAAPIVIAGFKAELGSWNTIWARVARGRSAAHSIVPSSRRSRPSRQRASVVLPEPDSPTTPTASPAPTTIDTSSSAGGAS